MYCHISTKYSLYSFQKFFINSKKFILPILLLLLCLIAKCQVSDTLSFKLKKTKINIIKKNGDFDEWDFENDENENEKIKKRQNLSLSLGWLSLNTNPLIKSNNRFQQIPYHKILSNVQNINYYLKHFSFLKDKFNISLGTGLKVQRLYLGKNKTIISDDTLYFKHENSFTNNQNVLTYRYWCIPLTFTFPNLEKLKPQLEFSNNILINGKLIVGKIKDIKTITKSRFFQKRYFLSARAKLMWANIGFFAETSIIPTSTIFNNQYNFSCGIIFGNYR